MSDAPIVRHCDTRILMGTVPVFLFTVFFAVQLSAMEAAKEIKTEFPNTKLGGYAQIQYEAYPDAAVNTSTDTFTLKRIRISIKSVLSEEFSGALEFDATKFNTITGLKYAYLDWNRHRYCGVRFGQFKMPFSRESYASDSILDFADRSMATDNLIGKLPDLYDTGVQFSGKRSMFDYAFAVTNGQAENTIDDNAQKALIARVVMNPLGKLYAGGSSYYSENGKTYTIRRKAGAELRYEMEWGFMQAEYIKAAEGATLKDGWYLYAFITPLKSLQTGLRYEAYDPNNSVSSDESDAFTGGANYLFTPMVKFVFNITQKNTKNAASTNTVILRMQYVY